MQVVSRAHRMGAKQAVQVEVLAMKGTLEERLLQSQQQRRQQQGVVAPAIGGGAATAAPAGRAARGEVQARAQRNRLLEDLRPVPVRNLPEYEDFPEAAEAAEAAADPEMPEVPADEQQQGHVGGEQQQVQQQQVQQQQQQQPETSAAAAARAEAAGSRSPTWPDVAARRIRLDGAAEAPAAAAVVGAQQAAKQCSVRFAGVQEEQEGGSGREVVVAAPAAAAVRVQPAAALPAVKPEPLPERPAAPAAAVQHAAVQQEQQHQQQVSPAAGAGGSVGQAVELRRTVRFAGLPESSSDPAAAVAVAAGPPAAAAATPAPEAELQRGALPAAAVPQPLPALLPAALPPAAGAAAMVAASPAPAEAAGQPSSGGVPAAVPAVPAAPDVCDLLDEACQLAAASSVGLDEPLVGLFSGGALFICVLCGVRDGFAPAVCKRPDAGLRQRFWSRRRSRPQQLPQHTHAHPPFQLQPMPRWTTRCGSTTPIA